MPTALASLLLAATLTGPIPEPMLPPVSLDDLVRFPSHRLAEQMDDFGIAHRSWVQSRIWELEGNPTGLHYLDSQDRQAELTFRRLQLQEAYRLGDCWTYLWRAHGGYTADYPAPTGATWPVSTEGRLECLRQLRQLLGPAAYYSGQMPPPVPIVYFTRND